MQLQVHIQLKSSTSHLWLKLQKCISPPPSFIHSSPSPLLKDIAPLSSCNALEMLDLAQCDGVNDCLGTVSALATLQVCGLIIV